MTVAEFPSLQKFNDRTSTKRHVGDTIFSHAWRERKACAYADFAFMLKKEDTANGPITLVTIFQPNSS
jgi:hypothetical protein